MVAPKVSSSASSLLTLHGPREAAILASDPMSLGTGTAPLNEGAGKSQID